MLVFGVSTLSNHSHDNDDADGCALQQVTLYMPPPSKQGCLPPPPPPSTLEIERMCSPPPLPPLPSALEIEYTGSISTLMNLQPRNESIDPENMCQRSWWACNPDWTLGDFLYFTFQTKDKDGRDVKRSITPCSAQECPSCSSCSLCSDNPFSPDPKICR